MPPETEQEPEVVFDRERTVVAVRASAFHTVMAAIQAAGMREGASLESGEVRCTEAHGMQLKFNAAVLAVKGLGYFRAMAKGGAQEEEADEERRDREARHGRLLGLDHELRVATLELVQAQHPSGTPDVDADFYETYLKGLKDE